MIRGFLSVLIAVVTSVITMVWGMGGTDHSSGTVSFITILTSQSAQEAWRRYQDDVATLIGMVGRGGNPDDIQRQVERVNRDLDRLRQEMARGTLIEESDPNTDRSDGSLPSDTVSETTALDQGRGISVTNGDPGVSPATLDTVTRIVRGVSLPVLHDELGLQPLGAEIVVFSSPDSYGAALRRVGIPSALVTRAVMNTGGMTVGDSTVWIPLFNLRDDSDLANVVTHELTHVVFNQLGLARRMPVWLNEGTAWVDGLRAQAVIDLVKVAAEERLLDDGLRTVAARGGLLPLSTDENGILGAPYNVEWQDYRVVRDLIDGYGLGTFQAFLIDAVTEGVPKGFELYYRMSLQRYEDRADSALVRDLTTETDGTIQ